MGNKVIDSADQLVSDTNSANTFVHDSVHIARKGLNTVIISGMDVLKNAFTHNQYITITDES